MYRMGTCFTTTASTPAPQVFADKRYAPEGTMNNGPTPQITPFFVGAFGEKKN